MLGEMTPHPLGGRKSQPRAHGSTFCSLVSSLIAASLLYCSSLFSNCSCVRVSVAMCHVRSLSMDPSPLGSTSRTTESIILFTAISISVELFKYLSWTQSEAFSLRSSFAVYPGSVGLQSWSEPLVSQLRADTLPDAHNSSRSVGISSICVL